jgi:S-formylglutathione hydrolase
MIGCGVSTGWGAVLNNSDVEPGTTVAVWGLGAVGLAAVQAAKLRGASKIYGIDINEGKFDIAKKFGADVCYKPTKEKSAKEFLLENEKWGINYTFDATGNTDVMREALESAHRGVGYSCVIGVAESGKVASTAPFQLVTGRRWIGTAFGGWKGVEDVPKLVNRALTGELPIKDYITHEFEGLDKVNESISTLRGGECLRAVIKINPVPPPGKDQEIKIVSSAKLFGGVYHVVEHRSEEVKGKMTFGIFLPDEEIKHQRGKPYPALYCLGGLSCTHENFATKSGFASYAKKHRIACVFPDTSPRNTGIEGIDKDWEFGNSASYYLDATSDAAKDHFRMFSYITKELPDIVSSYFPVSRDNISTTGFSMGGHGALIAALKTGQYKSASAFAPISNPTVSENWGKKGFRFFFNKPEDEGKEYDSTELVRQGKAHKVPLFVEAGTQDAWKHQCLCENLRDALIEADYEHTWKVRPGYNHSFWYVSSFIEEHFNFHAKYLL